MDVEGGEYYAQVRSIMVDNSEDVSVVLTWLVPTSEARRGEFDPAKYVIGLFPLAEGIFRNGRRPSS